jgi:hypothetical protein
MINKMVIENLVERKNVEAKMSNGKMSKKTSKNKYERLFWKVLDKDVIIARAIFACVLVNLSLVDQSVTMVLVDTCMRRSWRAIKEF